jgi:hypothetical protein
MVKYLISLILIIVVLAVSQSKITNSIDTFVGTWKCVTNEGDVRYLTIEENGCVILPMGKAKIKIINSSLLIMTVSGNSQYSKYKFQDNSSQLILWDPNEESAKALWVKQ